ncbi:MAG: ATP-binding protein [Candidatus Diapherotrites archaeon]|nr:ATP-binding protein [Candidatus Diapherotrites archaeon]
MVNKEFSEAGSEVFIPISDRVEKTIETGEKDIFDDVFEKDEDEVAAKKRMLDKVSELKKKELLKMNSIKEESSGEESIKENRKDNNDASTSDKNKKESKNADENKDEADTIMGKDDDEDENDDKDEDEDEDDDEDDTKDNKDSGKDGTDGKGDSTEPVIFREKEIGGTKGNADKENKKGNADEKNNIEKEGNKEEENEEKEEEFETKDDAFDAVDAGGKKPKKSANNFDDIIKENMEKSLKNNNTSKGFGGKLDLKVVHEEDEVEEEKQKAHPIERKIIKSVIKNKALMAIGEGLKINKGIKLNTDSKRMNDKINSEKKKKNSQEKNKNDLDEKYKSEDQEEEDHDEMADDLLREDGIREEGISSGEIEENKENNFSGKGPSMPKAVLAGEEIEAEDGKDGVIKPDLEFLMSNKGHAFIGRKKSVLGKYGEEAGLFVGKVYEKDKEGTEVYLDGLNPHVVFVCGARGSGKSYVLGVIAEELAMKNKNVGIVVVDPIGVFWSMKHPNKEDKELEALAKWDLLPRGLDNVKVFIPVGMKDAVPKSTYDAVFSIQPALLTAEDWCLTFGIDRFSPTGLLMEKGIAKVKSGYETEEGKEIRGKLNTFSLDDLAKCFEFDKELNNKEKGYKADSIRALVSRFDAAKHWGIFEEKGTSLGLLSRAGQMTILDTSFLEDNVSALVIGIISRRILSARKLGTRREAAGKFEGEEDFEDVVDLNIPPTWLFIDEAHTLIPGGNQKTPASSALVEYVKQGRRPGCSLVFATQQPSAIDSRVLSQLDVIMAHKLVFDDDIKSIYKRTPTIVPFAYKKSSFIKTMPVGIALTGDRSETTSRAFVMKIRPRLSQHEGRDAETVEVKQELERDKVELLAVNIVLRQLEKDPSIRIDSIKETLDTLNNAYKKDVLIDAILAALEKKGIEVKDNSVFAKGVLEELAVEEEEEKALLEKENEELEPQNAGQTSLIKRKLPKDVEEFGEKLHEFDEKIELTSLKQVVDEQNARKKVLGFAPKKFGLFTDEIIDRISLKHAPIYKIKYKYFSHKDAYHVGEAYINSLTGEFIHDAGGKLRESKGLMILSGLSEAETTVLKLVAEKKRNSKEVAELMRMEEGNAKRILDGLAKKWLIAIVEDGKNNITYNSGGKYEMDLPPTPLHEMLTSIGKMPITELEAVSIIRGKLTENEIPDLLKKLWGNVVVKEVSQIFLPVWEGVLKKKAGEERIILIDAINGKKVEQS